MEYRGNDEKCNKFVLLWAGVCNSDWGRGSLTVLVSILHYYVASYSMRFNIEMVYASMLLYGRYRVLSAGRKPLNHFMMKHLQRRVMLSDNHFLAWTHSFTIIVQFHVNISHQNNGEKMGVFHVIIIYLFYRIERKVLRNAITWKISTIFSLVREFFSWHSNDLWPLKRHKSLLPSLLHRGKVGKSNRGSASILPSRILTHDLSRQYRLLNNNPPPSP